MKVVIVSGISGSGKTTFLKALEDTGFFCVDNFPLFLLQKFLEVYELAGDRIARCGFVIDIREREFFEEGREILRNVKEKYQAELVFLESADETLLRRFTETRRAHPLYAELNIKDALQTEREQVGWIKEMANNVIDTSQYTTHGLRNLVLRAYGQDEKRMNVNLVSFGYAYGIPLEADIVLDVRFLPNPYFVKGLREKSGLEPDVIGYVKSNEVYGKFFPMLLDFMMYLLPLFEKEGKSYLTIGIGCTGGRHRSVSVVTELEHHLRAMGYKISSIHRDVEREER
jgi:RNase adapter protein RapZ